MSDETHGKLKIRIGDRFGRWSVLSLEYGNPYAKCRCDCGTERDVYIASLLSKKSTSCGCYKAERAKENTVDIEKIKEIYAYDGTRIDKIRDRPRQRNNSTGHTGVTFIAKKNRYRAYINLRGKQIHLGLYHTLKEAVDARKAAEEDYYKPIIEEWEEEKK